MERDNGASFQVYFMSASLTKRMATCSALDRLKRCHVRSLLSVQVLRCLADLASLPARPLLLTITGRVLGTPQQRRTRSGDSLITIKLDDVSLAGGAAFRAVAVSYLHDADRFMSAPHMTACCSCLDAACCNLLCHAGVLWQVPRV